MAILKNESFSAYHLVPPPKPIRKLVQWSLDARRAAIFFKKFKKRLPADIPKEKPYNGAPNVAKHSGFVANIKNESLEDYVAIIDLDSEGLDHRYEIIKLPFIPKELSYNSESAFASIKPMGRNNPFYHYTGAEDKLEFEIDWHAFDWGRREVIENCRKIESLSKADAYSGGPHKIMLKWGKENILFSDHEFIILSASYRMTQFNKGNINSSGQVESTYMLPIQAYQKVVLGRITSNNLSKVDIEFVNYAPLTRAYKITEPGISNKLIR